jgi:RimJ/RimL family protein N-acetyltransferase
MGMSDATRAAQAVSAGHFSFRPLQAADLPMLHGWLARPHWTEWWGEAPTMAEVQAEYGAWINNPAQVQPHIAMLGGKPFAYIQSYVAMGSGGGWWEDETDPGVRGIDQSITDGAQLGKGFGTAMVKAFVAQLFADPNVTRIQTDPDPCNARAIRCYEKAGFRAVGEVQTPDGTALLMVCERSG